MKLSENNKTRLYAAISEPIMEQRIVVAQGNSRFAHPSISEIDDMLFRLESKIWREVKGVLNLKD